MLSHAESAFILLYQTPEKAQPNPSRFSIGPGSQSRRHDAQDGPHCAFIGFRVTMDLPLPTFLLRRNFGRFHILPSWHLLPQAPTFESCLRLILAQIALLRQIQLQSSSKRAACGMHKFCKIIMIPSRGSLCLLDVEHWHSSFPFVFQSVL